MFEEMGRKFFVRTGKETAYVIHEAFFDEPVGGCVDDPDGGLLGMRR